MTAYRAGLALLRAEDWPPTVDGPALLVMAAMASFAADDDPTCTAGPTAIARRARVSVDTVRDRCRVLAGLGLIEHAGGGGRTGRPSRWRLVGVAGGRPATVGHGPTPQTEDRPPAQGGYATSPPRVGHQPNNPSDSSRPLGREEEACRSVPASADAPADPPPARSSVALLVERLGVTVAEARRLVADIDARCRATSPAARSRYRVEGVRRLIAQGAPSPTDELAPRRRRRGRSSTRAERLSVVERVNAGTATIESVAAEFGVTEPVVRHWVRSGGLT